MTRHITNTEPPGRSRAQVRSATRAVYTAFIANGFIFASWAARIPQVRDGLRVSPGVLGLILLSVAVGSSIATPLSGLVITWLGDARRVEHRHGGRGRCRGGHGRPRRAGHRAPAGGRAGDRGRRAHRGPAFPPARPGRGTPGRGGGPAQPAA